MRPDSDGGTNEPGNLYCCCRACNCSRQDKPLARVAGPETRAHIRRNVKRGLSVRLRDLGRGVLRLDVPRGGHIQHEEHKTIVLEPGTYEVRHQRTMTQPGIWERVRD